MIKQPSRRTFMRTVPLAAAAGLPLTDGLLFAAQSTPSPEPFKLFNADKLAAAAKHLQAAPGNDNLFDASTLPVTIVLTTEEKKSAKEFEYHEGRDHLFQILEGSTVYEIGGTPKDQRNTKPSEWLAPASDGAQKLTLHKGDMLLIPRGTPHKRSTEASVTFLLISTTGKT